MYKKYKLPRKVLQDYNAPSNDIEVMITDEQIYKVLPEMCNMLRMLFISTNAGYGAVGGIVSGILNYANYPKILMASFAVSFIWFVVWTIIGLVLDIKSLFSCWTVLNIINMVLIAIWMVFLWFALIIKISEIY